MSFDRLAPHYRWMEGLLAGGKLQRCRTTFLHEVQRATRVLLLGEGNGRFLHAFTQVNSSAHLTVLDSSAGMLRQARRRVAGSAAAAARIQFVQADIFTWAIPPEPFDLIVTNFFLDCFCPEQLAVLVPRLAAASSDHAQWLLSDFRLPAHGPAAWRARCVVAMMYGFFRMATKLTARTITPADSWLERSGFQLQHRRLSEWGLLHTDLWERNPSFTPATARSVPPS